MPPNVDLIETLRQAQRFGFFGARPIDEAIAHAGHYIDAIDGRSGRLLDLGAGGGLPGLVIAAARPDLEIVLLDRRQKRTDFLERAVQRLDFTGVAVWCRDALDVARSITRGDEPAFDVVTARGFGPPEFTLRTAVACLRPGGCVVISEPPSGDRWPAALLDELHLSNFRQLKINWDRTVQHRLAAVQFGLAILMLYRIIDHTRQNGGTLESIR